MAIYEVFCHSLKIRYKTTICSKATVFYFVSIILAFVPPLLITYRSQGFWLKTSVYREQPDIHFKHKMLLMLESLSGNHFVWSSFPKLNELLSSHVRNKVPSVEHIEKDNDRDGRNDEIEMKIEVPLTDEKIVSVKLLLIFDYKLHLYSSLEMESLAYIQHSSPVPGESLHVVGELGLHQRQPLYHRGRDLRYNSAIVDETSSNVDVYKLENIFSVYSSRNVSTFFRNSYATWKSGRAVNEPFNIFITIIYPEESIQYKVGFWQLIKWAYVQYIAVLCVFLYGFERIKTYVFQHRLVPSIAFSPLKKE